MATTMRSQLQPSRPAGARTARSPEIPDFATGAAMIAEQFTAGTALGVMMFDLSVLDGVEQTQGFPARIEAVSSFSRLLREVAGERLADCDLVMEGEPGRNELLVVLLRKHQDARFYRQELPGFDQTVRRKLEREGAKLFYPYLKKLPSIEMGYSVMLRNPKLGVDTQLRRVVAEAREDVALNTRISQRKLRRRFYELLLDHQVYSVYEPIVEVGTNVVFGYEALARGPDGTDLNAPIAMFTEARRQGLVYELDCLCRASGLTGAVDFPEGTKLFLNVLPSAIHDPDFRADRLIRTLAECRLTPNDVVFEVSEQESIRDFDAFREMRDYYRSLGFAFALDDTGSGYAGLEALLEISPEYIKIDRAFVSGVDEDPVRQDVLRALRGVADKTGARIIGEGLNRLEELAMLGELGIHFGQGWLFGHPHPLRAREDKPEE
jgi:EAL domain-containing protein (putative c-di-GMP-specific phosphodiesterase class I)